MGFRFKTVMVGMLLLCATARFMEVSLGVNIDYLFGLLILGMVVSSIVCLFRLHYIFRHLNRLSTKTNTDRDIRDRLMSKQRILFFNVLIINVFSIGTSGPLLFSSDGHEMVNIFEKYFIFGIDVANVAVYATFVVSLLILVNVLCLYMGDGYSSFNCGSTYDYDEW